MSKVKTKPTQHSVGLLRQIGIQPDILICRTERTIAPDDIAKIALFCNVEPKAVIEERDKECKRDRNSESHRPESFRTLLLGGRRDDLCRLPIELRG